MRIANVALSSMKGNGPELCAWLRHARPDIVTLQKTGKAEDFPTDTLLGIGYRSAFLGARSLSDLGVAVLIHRERAEPDVRVRRLPGSPAGESRFLGVNTGGVRVCSIYAPYGPPHPLDGTRSAFRQAIERRVDWLNRLRDHVRESGYAGRDSLLCGDFNVKVRADGPLRGGGYYSERERDAFEDLLSLGFVDLYREAHPCWKAMPGFTHRFGDKYPQGSSRLHLALASKLLAARLRSARVDVESSPWPRKDAPPLVVDIDFDPV